MEFLAPVALPLDVVGDFEHSLNGSQRIVSWCSAFEIDYLGVGELAWFEEYLEKGFGFIYVSELWVTLLCNSNNCESSGAGS